MSQSIDARYADMLRGKDVITRKNAFLDPKRKQKAHRKSAGTAKVEAAMKRMGW